MVYFWILAVSLLIDCPWSVKAVKQYHLQFDADSLNVSVGNVQLLQHTQQSPVIFVGNGQLTIAEFRGNFFINNYVENRVGLTGFNVLNSTCPDQDVIQLFYGNTICMNVTLSSTADHQLVVTLSGLDHIYNDIWIRVAATKDEMIYGLGEQFSFLNLRGQTYPIWTREQGVGRNKSDIVTFMADIYGGGAGGNYHTTYFPQPTFVSSRKFYCHYTGLSYAEFNFQQSNFHEIYISGQAGRLEFNVDKSLKILVGRLSKYLGLQLELPSWVYTGAILGVQGGTQTMLDRYNQAVENGVPVSALWIQDWAGVLQTSFGKRLFWDWKWNRQLYPGLDQVIKELKTNGVKVLGYINPHLNANGDLFKEASAHGYFVKNTTGQPYLTDFGEFFCGTVDLTNPDASTWYKGIIQTNMIDLGFGGWMADFGEYLSVDDTYFYNNQSGRTLHNQWPVLWAEINKAAVDEKNVTGDVIFWMRAGGAGIGKFARVMWAGDQNVDFSYADGLPSTIPAALNMGMSGVGITHFDIGGYTTAAQFNVTGHALVRNAELLIRSAEAAIFTPLFRTHEGNQPQANFQFYTSNHTEQQFGRLASIYVHISNYTKSLVRENTLLGIPVQRPLFMEFPNDTTSWTITYQYMFGSDVLVAPVIQPSVISSLVYLPPGSWRFIWNKNDYSGRQFVNVLSPIGQPPAFYKKNSSWATLFEQIQSHIEGCLMVSNS